MITLERVEIHKYKSIENTQAFEVDKGITILVGMNESGKTNVLEALAKVNYFNNDEKFKFNITHDYPRKELKSLQKNNAEDITPKAITCYYRISEKLKEKINDDLGSKIFKVTNFSYTKNYTNAGSFGGLEVSSKDFLSNYFKDLKDIEQTLKDKLMGIDNIEAIDNIIKELQQEKEKHNELIEKLETLKEFYHNECDWRNPISEYIMRVWIKPNLPKFLYYDEYYSLPSRVSIQKLQQERLEAEELKTAQALFELANIDIETLIKSNDFEDFQAELEATESAITDELFKFWDTNKNLQIEFKIDKVSDSANRQILEHILDIRVKNTDKRVSLPLNKRSKGFNWFFSFLVWFKKIQEDKNAQYILLLDEPGLNLHAMAQENLLNFLEELSKQYQIIYTTHSPFMIDSSHLERVRTIFETKEGSKISDSLQEKDPNTLFPLQAALGYNIAQNLFISKNNLIVEGISDLTYLTYMSSLLQENGKEGLSDDITIIPVGGADKVSAFISLMRGNKLKIVCLLDTFTEQKPKAHIDNLMNKERILKSNQVIFYDKFTEIDVANIEDIFTTEEYLKLFNEAFSEYDNINVEDIDKSKTILDEISKIIGKPRFNHYIPAKLLVSKALKIKDFGDTTINRFEKIFAEVNRFLQK